MKDNFVSTFPLRLGFPKNKTKKNLLESTFLTHFVTDLFWYPLETLENQRFSDVFRGYQKRSVAWNGLIERVFLRFCSNEKDTTNQVRKL